MPSFFKFTLQPDSQPFALSSLPDFLRFHLSLIYSPGKTSKKSSVFVEIEGQKILLAAVDKARPTANLDLWFDRSQKCSFSVEGDKVTVIGSLTRKAIESSIADEDEFKAIAFKANELGQTLDKLHSHKGRK